MLFLTTFKSPFPFLLILNVIPRKLPLFFVSNISIIIVKGNHRNSQANLKLSYKGPYFSLPLSKVFLDGGGFKLKK